MGGVRQKELTSRGACFLLTYNDPPEVHYPLRRQRQMCIRDSDDADAPVSGDANGLGPVSYTHLRAHETVLDLV